MQPGDPPGTATAALCPFRHMCLCSFGRLRSQDAMALAGSRWGASALAGGGAGPSHLRPAGSPRGSRGAASIF